jgi:hypothetical protein
VVVVVAVGLTRDRGGGGENNLVDKRPFVEYTRGTVDVRPPTRGANTKGQTI